MVTKCLLIGRHCTAVHIVDVIPLYPLAVPKTHRDLDFFMWSRGLPHYADNYVDLHSGRVLLNFKKLGDMKRYKADYIVVHFDQVRRLFHSKLRHSFSVHVFCSFNETYYFAD